MFISKIQHVDLQEFLVIEPVLAKHPHLHSTTHLLFRLAWNLCLFSWEPQINFAGTKQWGHEAPVSLQYNTQMLHVWHIYLHLGDF